MKVAKHYTKFVYPFNLSRGTSRKLAISRLLESGRWEPVIHDVTAGQRHPASKTADEERTEYLLPYARHYLFPTIRWPPARFDEFRKLQNRRAVRRLERRLRPLTCLYFRFKHAGNAPHPNGMLPIPFTVYRHETTIASGNVEDIRLQLMESDLGMLTLRVTLNEDDGPLELATVMHLNYELRAVEAFHSAHTVVRIGLGERRWTPIQFLNHLLAEFDKTESISNIKKSLADATQRDRIEGIRDVFDDRALVYSFVCLQKENTDPRALEISGTDYLTIRSPGGSAQLDETYSQRLRARGYYSRWKNSVYSFSKEGGCFLGTDDDSVNLQHVPRYFDTYYFDIFTLALYQRLLLLRISDDLSDIEYLLANTRSVAMIRRRMLDFTNRCWYTQVTSRQQGQDIYEKWVETFDTRTLFGEVREKIAELDEALMDRSRTKRDKLLLLVTILVLPLTIASSFLGMNVEEFGSGVISLGDLVPYFVVATFGFPLLVLLLAFPEWMRYWSRQSLYSLTGKVNGGIRRFSSWLEKRKVR